jgi:hypothetical protein
MPGRTRAGWGGGGEGGWRAVVGEEGAGDGARDDAAPH